MTSKNIAEQINRTIEEIWIALETKERNHSKFKLNGQQFVLLTLIIHHPSSTPSELAEKMNMSKSAISQQLLRLENEKYIIRKQNINDRRGYTVYLGEKGLLYQKEAEEFQKKISYIYNSSLSAEELANMLTTLQKLLKVLL